MSIYEDKEKKVIDIETITKALEGKIEDNVFREKRSQGTTMLSDNEILQVAKQTYNEVLRTELQNTSTVYETELKKLKDELALYKPKQQQFTFRNGWDKDIQKIKIEFYTIKVKSIKQKVLLDNGEIGIKQVGACPICSHFREIGLEAELGNIWNDLNIPEAKLEFLPFYVDQADRFLSNKTDPNYNSRLSPNGLLWYYCKGIGIRKYPAFDLTVIFHKGNVGVDMKDKFYRRQGLGRRDGRIYYLSLKEAIINFFRTWDERQLSKIETHGKNRIYNDMEREKRDGKR